ncbi:MAG: hypothetical protein ACR2L2_20400, partial [Acidobacteriota bacterium]
HTSGVSCIYVKTVALASRLPFFSGTRNSRPATAGDPRLATRDSRLFYNSASIGRIILYGAKIHA